MSAKPSALLAIALCVALAGCGKRETEAFETETPFVRQTCQYVEGQRLCIVRFNDGRICRTYGGSMQCDPTNQPEGQSK